MSPKEFKAWFAAYVAIVGDAPDKAQFAEIKSKVLALDTRPRLREEVKPTRILEWGSFYVADDS